MSQKSEENQQLDQILEADWDRLSREGRAAYGFKTIEVTGNGARRWMEDHTVITRGPSGQHYSWNFDQGLTEMQEDDYYMDGAKPVYPHKVVQVTTVWKDEPEA